MNEDTPVSKTNHLKKGIELLFLKNLYKKREVIKISALLKKLIHILRCNISNYGTFYAVPLKGFYTMKQTASILSLVLMGLLFFQGTSSTGISFYHGSFADAKKQAKESGKIVFIDAYTTWCGPCRKMAAQVFTDHEVAEYFNKTFVNVKMDMEKTDGILAGRRYNVRFYPSLIFIKPSGELIRMEEGYHTKSQLLKLGREVAR